MRLLDRESRMSQEPRNLFRRQIVYFVILANLLVDVMGPNVRKLQSVFVHTFEKVLQVGAERDSAQFVPLVFVKFEGILLEFADDAVEELLVTAQHRYRQKRLVGVDDSSSGIVGHAKLGQLERQVIDALKVFVNGIDF